MPKEYLNDYNELVAFVGSFDGSFDDLFSALKGFNIERDHFGCSMFDTNFKSICTTVIENKTGKKVGKYFEYWVGDECFVKNIDQERPE